MLSPIRPRCYEQKSGAYEVKILLYARPFVSFALKKGNDATTVDIFIARLCYNGVVFYPKTISKIGLLP